MERVAVFLAAVIPALLLLGYGVAKVRASWRSEALWTAFFLGASGALAAAFGEFFLLYLLNLSLLPPLLDAAATALLIAAIPEETIKFIMLVGPAERHVDARRVQDILVLALGVSLGFASLENLIYVAAPGDWKLVATGRAITAVPGHGIDGLAMGALLTAARLRPGRSGAWLAAALAVPIVLHAAYDFPLFAIKGHAEEIWLGLSWIAILALSAIFVVCLCNRILPAAAEADRASGRDSGLVVDDNRLLVGCVMLLVAGPIFGGALFLLNEIGALWVGAGLGVLPAVLGIDLFLTGLRRRKTVILAS